MAKTISKKTEAAPKKASKAKASVGIEKIAQAILDKLEALQLEPALQSDLVWCLGSYSHDQNPVGLVAKIAQALVVLKAEVAKKTKGITAKFITDSEKALTALAV
jgi:hypothetical protein